MMYNLSPEKIITDPEQSEHLKQEKYDLHEIRFDFNGKEILGWSVRHGNKDQDIGLYPRVLIDLFAKRAKEKHVLPCCPRPKIKSN